MADWSGARSASASARSLPRACGLGLSLARLGEVPWSPRHRVRPGIDLEPVGAARYAPLDPSDLVRESRWTARSRPISALSVKAVCARCPVADDCLDWAVQVGEVHGVWGRDHARGTPLSATHSDSYASGTDASPAASTGVAGTWVDAPPRHAERAGRGFLLLLIFCPTRIRAGSHLPLGFRDGCLPNPTAFSPVRRARRWLWRCQVAGRPSQREV